MNRVMTVIIVKMTMMGRKLSKTELKLPELVVGGIQGNLHQPALLVCLFYQDYDHDNFNNAFPNPLFAIQINCSTIRFFLRQKRLLHIATHHQTRLVLTAWVTLSQFSSPFVPHESHTQAWKMVRSGPNKDHTKSFCQFLFSYFHSIGIPLAVSASYSGRVQTVLNFCLFGKVVSLLTLPFIVLSRCFTLRPLLLGSWLMVTFSQVCMLCCI